MAAIKITKSNFQQEVLDSTIPVLLDFWAPWCGPCKMLSPVIDEIAGEITTAKICKINIDEEPELATKYQVMSIPTLILIKEGKVAETSVGGKPKAALLQMLS